jgi:hypothetical protein
MLHFLESKSSEIYILRNARSDKYAINGKTDQSQTKRRTAGTTGKPNKNGQLS